MIKVALVSYFDSRIINNGIGSYCENLIESINIQSENNIVLDYITPYTLPGSNNNINFIKFAQKIRYYLSKRQKKYDLIHSTSGAGFLSKTIDIESIHHLEPFFTFSNIHSLPNYITARKSKNIVTISKFTANQVRKIYDHNKVKIINNGIDTSYFKPSKIINNNNKYKAIYVGSLTSRKQPLLLLKWLLNNKNTYLTIFGTGPLKNKIEQISSKIGLNHRLTITSGNKLSLLNNLHRNDFFIFPSSLEGFGLSLVEAVSTGLPFLSFDVGIAKHLHDNGLGLVVEDNSEFINTKADKIIKFKNPSQSYNFIKKHYSLKKMGSSFLNYYNKIYENKDNL